MILVTVTYQADGAELHLPLETSARGTRWEAYLIAAGVRA